jgi:CheY-like chemotaxis protein/anti-sigma regulatory factor (Ser/Thr protein kinase)
MPKVLVVDDNPVDLKLASRCVEDERMEAVFAKDGREALAVVGREPPDVVLTDLDMPGLDGLELVRALQKSHASVPVILMTAKGSEEVAAEALRAGASSYVPKRKLKQLLGPALRMVWDVAKARQQRQQVFAFLKETNSRFVMGYEPSGPPVLVSHLQDGLRMMNLCPEGELVRVGLAVTEALLNARDHGNLELNSALRDELDGRYFELGSERSLQSPYRDRRVSLSVRLTDADATFVVADEGRGFDPTTLPDPTDPENLMKAHGRGLMLIRTFMDEVRFNATGNEITMVKRKKVQGERGAQAP